MVLADKNRIKQIILGLQSNALKFTQKGHVKIEAGIVNEDAQRFLEVIVHDTGVGIKEENIGKLFKLYGFLEDT